MPMSLQQGPTDLLITSVAHANRSLIALKAHCHEQEQYHRQIMDQFLIHLHLDEIRQIPKRYSEKQLDEALVESATCYSLTVNSSFTIVAHGIDALERYFTHSNHIQLNQLLSLSSRSLMLLAKTKLQLEKNLTDFMRDRRKIEKHSIEDDEELPSESAPQDNAFMQEIRDKTALEQTIQILDADIKTLTEPERFIIEYYETVLKANAIFNKLTEFKKDLISLQGKLEKLKPIEETPTPLSKNWESSFGDTDLFNGSDLATLLKTKLSLHAQASDIATEIDWDVPSLPGSKRGSLLQPASPSAMNAALLLQFQHQAAVPIVRTQEEHAEEEEEVIPSANVHPEPGTTHRPDL
jgi:hypothetical protein